MNLKGNLVFSKDGQIKFVPTKKYSYIGLCNYLEDAMVGFEPKDADYAFVVINTEASYQKPHYATSGYDQITNRPVMNLGFLNPDYKKCMNLVEYCFKQNEQKTALALYIGGEFGYNLRSLTSMKRGKTLMISNDGNIFVNGQNDYVGIFKNGYYFTTIFEISDSNPVWRKVSSEFYEKDMVEFKNLGGEKWCVKFGAIEDFNKFWNLLGLYELTSNILDTNVDINFEEESVVTDNDKPKILTSTNSRITYDYKGLNEYRNMYFSDVYRISVDGVYVGERHIDSSYNRDLFFICGKDEKFTQDDYEDLAHQYTEILTADEGCVIAKNEDDMLFAVDELGEKPNTEFYGFVLSSESGSDEIIEVSVIADESNVITEANTEATNLDYNANPIATIILLEQTHEIFYTDNEQSTVFRANNIGEIINNSDFVHGEIYERFVAALENNPTITRYYATYFDGMYDFEDDSESVSELSNENIEEENNEYDPYLILSKYDLEKTDDKFRYQLLGRLQADCEYYLNAGAHNPKVLWAGNEKEQIEIMRALWESFSIKPQWLSLEQINKYAVLMGVE